MTARRSGRRLHIRTPPMMAVVKTHDQVVQTALVVAGRVVRARDPLVVGSGENADVTVTHEHVSGRHATFRHDPSASEGTVEDLGSTNGTWVRGQRIPPRTPVTVRPGDCVLLGRYPVVIARAAKGPKPWVSWNHMIAADPRSLRTLCEVGRLAAFDSPVWIRGESGTGKERVARALHDAGSRREGSFVALNCAALPAELAEAELFGSERGAFTGAQRRAGAFEQADGGTLLLDEVGELSPQVQAKLLRVLETGEVRRVGATTTRRVDVRILSATWRDLTKDAATGRFRFDLLQRLAVLRLDVPPLRDRLGDIEPLTDHLLETLHAANLRPTLQILHELRQQHWPGNVRQLRNTVQRAVVSGCWSHAVSSIEHPSPSGLMRPLMRHGDDGDRIKIAHRAIAGARGNRAQAARALGVSRSTLYRWLARTG